VVKFIEYALTELDMALSRRTRLGIIGVFVVVSLALVMVGNEPAIQYSVDEVMDSPSQFDDDDLHLRGTVAIGSFDSVNRTFLITGDSHNLTINAAGVAIPPAFEEGRVVAIKGILSNHAGEWTLSADEIITGCPSKYEAE
jgi:cytochrome c-type biogenesis protein CcmE